MRSSDFAGVYYKLGLTTLVFKNLNAKEFLSLHTIKLVKLIVEAQKSSLQELCQEGLVVHFADALADVMEKKNGPGIQDLVDVLYYLLKQASKVEKNRDLLTLIQVVIPKTTSLLVRLLASPEFVMTTDVMSVNRSSSESNVETFSALSVILTKCLLLLSQVRVYLSFVCKN